VNVHNGQPKPNLRRKRKVLSGLEGLLEIVGLEVTAEGVRYTFGELEGQSCRLYEL